MVFSKRGQVLGIPIANIIYFFIAVVAIVLFIAVGSGLINSTQNINSDIVCDNEEQWLLIKPVLERFNSGSAVSDSFIFYNNNCVIASFSSGQALQDYKLKPSFDINNPKLCMCSSNSGFCKPYACFTFDNFKAINSGQFTTFGLEDYTFISLKSEGKNLLVSTNAKNKLDNVALPDSSSIGIKGSLQDIISEASNIYGIDISLINAIIQVESNWDSNAVSACGAAGLTQLIPKTAIRFGLNIKNIPGSPSDNPYPWVLCDKCNAKNDNGDFIKVSSCNSCTPENCDYVGDERFDPEKSVIVAVKYLKNIKNILESKGIEANVINIAGAYHSGEGFVIDNSGVPAGSITEAYALKVKSEYEKGMGRV